MQLQDFVKYNELRCPTMLDANGEECITVVKNGATTGVTLGRATGIESFVCEYKDYAIHSTSMYIAVYPHSNKDGTFSFPGDSGSVVRDANYRIVGMLTSGAGKTDSTDVTYVSVYLPPPVHQEGLSPLLPLPGPEPDPGLGHGIGEGRRHRARWRGDRFLLLVSIYATSSPSVTLFFLLSAPLYRAVSTGASGSSLPLDMSSYG